MIESIKKIFRILPEADFSMLVERGAIVVDVRSMGEYKRAHIEGSLNIPIDELKESFYLLPDRQKPIITCCGSCFRSSSAQSILKSNGFVHVYNGGSWIELTGKI